MRELTIGETRIADDTPAYVVAEIGANHQGSVATCKMLFDAAAACGVNAVKLQKRTNEDLYTAEYLAQPYNSEHAFGATYGEHRAALEFDWDQYRDLKAYANGLGLDFFATAWDFAAADFLDALGVPAFKIASGDLLTPQLIRYCVEKGKPVIVSTGGGALDDVLRIDRSLSGYTDVAFLQCTASYPCRPAEMNLRVIQTYLRYLPFTVIGLSDHQDGISLAPVAYALGARIFEKHFTLDHTWKGSDQAFSLEPEGMKRMVHYLHQTYEALGDGVKRCYDSERGPLSKMQKSALPVESGWVFKSPVTPGAPAPWEVA